MNSGFNTEYLLVTSSDGRNFKLAQAFSFKRPSGEIIEVPVGTESDGASTPAVLWPTIPPFGKYWKAAYLHDYLYRYTQRNKDDCDLILKEAMKSLGVNPLEIEAIYEGVNLGGESSFEQDRKNQGGTK